MFQRIEAPSLTVANEDLRDRVRQAITNQKRPTVTVLSSLLAAQDSLGYIPDEAIDEVAAYTEASINEVWGVASFYKNFRFTPPGEHTVEICWGPSCHLVGATAIIERALEHVGLEEEGETDDGRLTVRYKHLPRSLRTGPGHQHRPSTSRADDAGAHGNADRQHPGKRLPLAGTRTT